MNTTKIATLLAAAALGGAALAQPGGPLLRDGEVTVDALVRALSPEERTRGIRVQPSVAGPSAGPMPESARPAGARPSASLLVTFETNSAELTGGARHTLDMVGRALASDELSEFDFVIEGHADPRGSPEANLRLSQARADSVRRYLREAHGIAERRLSAVGKGDREPMNARLPAAPENRRVTIVNASG